MLDCFQHQQVPANISNANGKMNSDRLIYGGEESSNDNHRVVSMNEYILWKNFKEGDLEAYAVIYRKYFFILFRYGKKVCNDPEMIKDAIQDLFIKLWNNREKLSDTTSIKYYLFTSLKRKLLDNLRSPQHRLTTEHSIVDYEAMEAEEPDEDLALWQKEKVLKALNKLSQHQQKLLDLKFYKDRSNQEIAQELGISIQSVYNAVFKALRSVRKQLSVILTLILFS